VHVSENSLFNDKNGLAELDVGDDKVLGIT
jgi:hypothetical protein